MTKTTELQAAVPVLETKLRRPTGLSVSVVRTRLLERLTASLDCRLILVSATAGYGKTALMSQWLGSVDSRYAWLSLDRQDDDLATFLLYIVAAIRTVYPEALGMVEQLRKAPTLPSASRLADALLQEMASLPGPLILALDDYHSIKTAQIHELVARLVEHMPDPIHLALITRADPPLPLDRLRGRGQLAEIRAEDLRFNPEETRFFLQQILGSRVTEETVALLEDSTEGWAVGLHLAALSLRNQSDPAIFARQIAQHGHQSVTDYLLSEVLTGLPVAQRNRLLQTSLFDRFCTSLIDETLDIIGENMPLGENMPPGENMPYDENLDGEDFVRAIQRANLFIVSLDGEGIWFRYHHFFQALLRARLSQQSTATEIKAIHARASAWFAARGLIDEAMTHALKAGDPVEAARLVEAQVHSALDNENWHRFERWIRQLPQEVCRRPRLLTAQAWLHILRYQFMAAAALLDSAESAVDEHPEAVRGSENIFWGEMNVLRAMIAHYEGNFKRTAQLTEAALERLGPETQYATGQAILYHIWSLQASGELDQAIEFARQQLEAYSLQANTLTLRILLVLANIYYELADLPRLQDTANMYRDLARKSGLAASLAWSFFMFGWLEYQRNDLIGAEISFRMLAEMSAAAHTKALVDGYTGLVLTALAQGRAHEARSVVAALRQSLIERELLSFTSVADSLEQRITLASLVVTPADPGSTLDWQPAATAASVPLDFWEQPTLTHVRTLLASGSPQDLAQAAELLRNFRAKAQARNLYRGLTLAGALQSLVLAAQGQETAALAALQEAVERAAPGGALRLIADCGPGLIPLLETLQTAGIAPRYIQKLLAVLEAQSTLPAASTSPHPSGLIPESEGMVEMLTNREIDVITLLAERLTDKEIAERLQLSPLTIKKHSQRIYLKLGVNNRRAAVIQARRLGLI